MNEVARPRDRRSTRSLHELRRAECSALLATDAARAAVAVQGTPVLLLDPERVRRQYRRLRNALPFARFHYAVKALSHDAVIDALAEAGCGFDVATGEELALLERHGVAPDRMIHTHPVKKAAEIAEAIGAGIRTFVIDNEAELEKFTDAPKDVGVLVRLSYRSPHAKSDLSSKFGVGSYQAAHLVERAVELGIRVSGFSFHVGSQLDDPARFAAAAEETLALMAALEERLPVRFDTLDIGGGFPVAYDTPVASIEEVSAALRPILEPHADRLKIIAEPGRIMVAEAMTLVTSVVGIAERADGRWYYLDDGLYGSYSNVMTEDVHPLVFAERELRGRDCGADDHRWATLGGPTCDSSDVIARELSLPTLTVGDLLVSPVMGAYTTVTATRFNGRPFTAVAVVGHGMTTGEVVAVSAAVAAVPETAVPQTVP
jgi:ornithine decarboxylase